MSDKDPGRLISDEEPSGSAPRFGCLGVASNAQTHLLRDADDKCALEGAVCGVESRLEGVRLEEAAREVGIRQDGSELAGACRARANAVVRWICACFAASECVRERAGRRASG